MRMLQLVDSDDRPVMGYLYYVIHVDRDEIIKRFQRRKKRVEPYLKIFHSRWDNRLQKNLHAAGFWLNPSFQYNSDIMANHRHTISGLLDVVEKFAHGNAVLRSKLTQEMNLFE